MLGMNHGYKRESPGCLSVTKTDQMVNVSILELIMLLELILSWS
jgi:hypothetical protein